MRILILRCLCWVLGSMFGYGSYHISMTARSLVLRTFGPKSGRYVGLSGHLVRGAGILGVHVFS